MTSGLDRYLALRDVRVAPDMNMHEAAQEILNAKASGASVVDADGNLVGVISELDCLQALITSVYNGNDPGGALVSEIMETNVEVAEFDADIIDVAASMLANNRRRRPVLKNGELVGQISVRQILRAITEDLE